MSEQPKPVSQRPPATASEAVKLLTAAAIGSSLLFVSGLTLTGTVIALVMATPILVLCSPILVPAGIVVFLVVTGFFFSCVCALAAVVALTWIYRYVTGKHPPGSDKLDYAREKIAEKAKDMRERAKEYGQYVQQKTQETAQTQQKTQETTQTQTQAQTS